MDNELNLSENWFKRHWNWLLPVSFLAVVAVLLFFSSGIDKAVVNMAKAYADNTLYEHALEKVKADPRATELLGEIEPIDKLAILEGSVGYSADDTVVETSVRIKGSKLIARMDISAVRIENKWNYTKINVRVKNPPEKRTTIKIIGKD